MSKGEIIREITAILRRSGLTTQPNVAFPWITNRAPTEDDRTTPPRVIYRLSALHVRLGGDWDARLAKRENQLRFDLLAGTSTLIEIDSVPHFSSARLISLGFYDDMEHALDLETYTGLCEEHRDRADRNQYSKRPVDFPFSGGRSAQTAYFDFCKDLLAPAYGYRLIRLPAPEGEFTPSMALTLRVML